MAQLVERLVRNEEASGSNPLSSTKTKTRRFDVFFCFVAKRSPKHWIVSGSRERCPQYTSYSFRKLNGNVKLPRNAWVYSLAPPRET